MTERDALVDFFEITGGAKWRDKGKWTSQEPLKSWFSVSVDETDRVVALIPFQNNLVGKPWASESRNDAPCCPLGYFVDLQLRSYLISYFSFNIFFGFFSRLWELILISGQFPKVRYNS